MPVEAIFFYGFSFLTVVTVIMMIMQKNPISSALCLVGSFFFLAALYAMLEAHFVAVLQILVYAGAIMVLFIFVIMLLNLRDDELIIDKMNFARLSVVLIGLVLAGSLSFKFLEIPVQDFQVLPEKFGYAKEIGALLFNKFILPFEVTGLLLLVGIVGAILLGRKTND